MAPRPCSRDGGGLGLPLLTQGSDDHEVIVVVRDGSGIRRDHQSAKQQIAQALKGGRKQPDNDSEEERELVANWSGQAPMLFTFLLSSVVAAVFAPALVPSQPMLLPALTAAALGLVGPVVHLFSRQLATSQALALHDQISLTSACTLAAGCLDLLAMIMTVAWAWFATNQPGFATAPTDMKPFMMFAFNCWQHGVVAVTVMQSVGSP